MHGAGNDFVVIDGVIHEEAANRAQAAGIIVVMDMCIWRDGGPCGRCVA